MKPQHALAQSASLLHGPVMNCAPTPLPAPELPEEAVLEDVVDPEVVFVELVVPVVLFDDVEAAGASPLKICAALSLGVAFRNHTRPHGLEPPWRPQIGL